VLRLAFTVMIALQNPDSACTSANAPAPPTAEQVAALRSMQDVIAVAALTDGSHAPDNIVLPTIVNRRQTLEYMRVHYPNVKKRKGTDARPIAWICVDRRGRVGSVKLLNASGDAAFDELSTNVFSVAAFSPGRVGDDTIGVWVPMPAVIPTKDELQYALTSDGFDHSTQPARTSFTDAPQLLNRSRIEQAITKVIYQVNRDAVLRNEAFDRAQQMGGNVIMWIYIDVEGNVTNSVVKKSSGNTDLDNTAAQLCSMMRFMPAKLNGKPVDVWIEVPLAFKGSR
jgi:TonB family protein